MKVNLEELEYAIDLVSADPSGEAKGYVDTNTGAVYYICDGIDTEVPDDLGSDRYLEVPHKEDFDLGTSLVFRFVRAELPDEFDRISGFFSKKGAYSKFNAHLDNIGALERWHQYVDQETREAIKEWCDDNSLSY
ncbi:UPF0158 family protein [Oceanobacter kriegii]|uniref:UPF0158 family protein n=1 Tax=Oceanobacter kriegii TaxID=64972 RepID=UPI00040BA8B9|nr:UPF0158 family protein [Oceanobacter kriegii]